MKNQVLQTICLQIAYLSTSHPDYQKAEPRIYYMNGNDGTDFDWQVNDRTCEFMVFYDEEKTGNTLGYIKADVTKDGELEYYRYTNNGYTIDEHNTLMWFEEDEIESLVNYLIKEYDRKDIYDSPIYDI